MDPCIPACGLPVHPDAESAAAPAEPPGTAASPIATTSASPVAVVPIKLGDYKPLASPPPPMTPGWQKFLASTSPPPPPYIANPIALQLGLTVLVALAALATLLSCFRHSSGARGRRALANANAAGASDGSWVLVQFVWAGVERPPGRMTVVGLRTSGELVAALVEFGAEEVDASISVRSVEIKYTDELGVERRLGGKTKLETARRAKLIMVRQRTLSEGEADGLLSAEQPGGASALSKQTRGGRGGPSSSCSSSGGGRRSRGGCAQLRAVAPVAPAAGEEVSSSSDDGEGAAGDGTRMVAVQMADV